MYGRHLVSVGGEGNGGLNYLERGLGFPGISARTRGTRSGWRRAQSDLIHNRYGQLATSEKKPRFNI